MKPEDIQPEVGHNTYYVIGAALVLVGMATSGFSNNETFALISVGLGAVLVILGSHWQKFVSLRTVVILQQRRIEKLELDTEQRIRALELAKIRIDAKVFPGEPSKYYDERGRVVPEHPSLDR